ncbi:MAG: serine protease [Syntrophales bacterium]
MNGKTRFWLLFVAVAIAVLAGCATGMDTRKDALAELPLQVENLEARVKALEARQRNMTDVLAKARGAVAFIWGTYTFVDKEGRPLRHVLNDLGEPVADPQGLPLVDVKGAGPIAVSDYCGTAFLIGANGEMLTNRHIAEPWWEDDPSEPLLAAGLRPVFLRLRAFFQERAEGIPIEVLRIDEKHDVALVRTAGWVPTVQPLTLHPNPGQDQEGLGILLVGYPTGLEAVLVMLEEGERVEMEGASGECIYETAVHLSVQKRLRATITSGFLWSVLPHLLVYDARTSGGGSGGPILDWSGTVIGINSAYLEEFMGGNYGVPIQFGKELLDGNGKPVQDAKSESRELLARFMREKKE